MYNEPEHYFKYQIRNSDCAIEEVDVKLHGEACIEDHFQAFKRFLCMAGYSPEGVEKFFEPMGEY